MVFCHFPYLRSYVPGMFSVFVAGILGFVYLLIFVFHIDTLWFMILACPICFQ